MWPELSGNDPFPIFSAELAPTVTKRMAGNVTWHSMVSEVSNVEVNNSIETTAVGDQATVVVCVS